MKYHLYYITRFDFESSFNHNLQKLLDFNPPVYTPLIFNDDVALYAYTDDKLIAKEFENTRNMKKFIKTKSKYLEIDNSIGCRKIEIKGMVTKLNNKIEIINMPIVESEHDFLNIDILGNLSEELMCLEFGLEETILYDLKKKYVDALSIIGFQKSEYYYGDSSDIHFKLDQFNLFVKIYKNLLKRAGDEM